MCVQYNTSTKYSASKGRFIFLSRVHSYTELPLSTKYSCPALKLSSPMILSRDRGVRSWSFGSSSNLMRTALMASGSGMLVNSAETSYAISFCPCGTSRFLTLSTKSPLFWMWCSDLTTRGQKYLSTHCEASSTCYNCS